MSTSAMSRWTPDDWAAWMVEQLERHRFQLLAQSVVVDALYRAAPAQKPSSLCYFDRNGYLCISRAVLRRFRQRTPNVVYSKSTKYWRYRESYDVPGRRAEG